MNKNKKKTKLDEIIYMKYNDQNQSTVPEEAREDAAAENRSSLVTDSEKDGKILLSFLNNDLEVRGDFFPPQTGGSDITGGYLNTLLEKFNITYGIKREEINAAIEECTKESRIVRDVLIARGDAPVNEVLEYMQLNPALGLNSEQINDSSPVDHRERSPFIIVKKDQALAKQKSRKPGKEGRNVHGEAMGYKVTRPEGVSGGENTRMEGKFLISCIGGQMVLKKGAVNVSDSLVINGPVGYSTGNINFPGNVEIEGPVSDGFKIYSGGSVTIKQTFDVTDAVIKDNLVVSGGIIGRGEALVKVGGALKTKFIQNCKVACRKTISADTEIINSNIFTLESLEMGDRGKIVGGEISALKGIRAYSIGREAGKAARIRCGLDFTLEQEKEKNNSILRILAAKLGRLRELLGDPLLTDDKKEKMEILRQRLEEEQRKTQANVTDILGRLNTYWNATVEARGVIEAGTLIEICQIALFVTTPLKKVRVRLERENSKLITENIK